MMQNVYLKLRCSIWACDVPQYFMRPHQLFWTILCQTNIQENISTFDGTTKGVFKDAFLVPDIKYTFVAIKHCICSKQVFILLVMLPLVYIQPHCLPTIPRAHPMMTQKELCNSTAISPLQFNCSPNNGDILFTCNHTIYSSFKKHNGLWNISN